MRLQFFQPDYQLSRQLGPFGLGLLDENFLCQFQLDKLLLDPDWDPMGIDVHNQLGSLEMFGDVQGEYRVVRVFVLFELELESAFVALSDLAILSEHGTELFLDELLRVSLSFLSQFILVHFFVHLLPHLLRICRFRLVLLLFSHILLCLSSFLLFYLSFF